jgi:hypothetical protein
MMAKKQEATTFPHLAGCSPVSAKLYEWLRTGKPGDGIGDEELGAVAGMPVGTGKEGNGYLHTALRRCAADGVHWSRVRNEQRLECLTATGVVKKADGNITSIRRSAGRTLRMIGTANMRDLPKEELSKAGEIIGTLGTIAQATEPAKRLAVRNTNIVQGLLPEFAYAALGQHV